MKTYVRYCKRCGRRYVTTAKFSRYCPNCRLPPFRKKGEVMNAWSYGLIEEKINGDKALVLSEVFFKNKEPKGSAYLDWNDFIKDKDMILRDIKYQIKNKKYIIVSNNKLKWLKEVKNG